MKQRDPGEPGRPNGCQDCPSPKHRLLWTVPKDIVRRHDAKDRAQGKRERARGPQLALAI